MRMSEYELLNKMGVSGRIKRILQAFTLMGITAYTTLLVYQTISHGMQVTDWENRSGRSVSRLVDVNLVEDKSLVNNVVETSNNKNNNNNNKVSTNDMMMPMVTGTMRPPATQLSDLFISVKTTKSYHDSRLGIILKTWFQLAKDQTWFFTDADDPVYQERTNGHMINTNCSSSHNRKALCCKMAVEFDVFLDSGKKWLCHFDDDNYVNVPRLVRLLGDYNPQEDWYLGKPSIRAPLEILNRDNSQQKISFWFATGGAGFCISRALALKMVPVASGGKFISIGEKIRLPDDVTMGYIIEHMLNKPLTVVDQFHSHLEPMKFLRQDTIHDQISFSYSNSKDEWNVVKIDGFSNRLDPKRFLSLHCHLYPQFSFCPR